MARRGFRQKKQKAAAPDPRRNTHVERGRPITVGDVAPHARQMCGKCKGKGMVAFQRDAEGKEVSATPCACATKRFFKAHPELIVEENGAAYWPLDHEAAKYQTVNDNGSPIERETRPAEPGEIDIQTEGYVGDRPSLGTELLDKTDPK